MSLSLDCGTKPPGLTAKTHGLRRNDTVYLGDYEISMVDFLALTHYVLTNTDLEEDDPRQQFLRSVQSMTEVKGFNSNAKRLETSIPPVLKHHQT